MLSEALQFYVLISD